MATGYTPVLERLNTHCWRARVNGEVVREDGQYRLVMTEWAVEGWSAVLGNTYDTACAGLTEVLAGDVDMVPPVT